MAIQTARRDFLRGDFGRDDVVRPPGAKPVGFARHCTGCGDCAEACPEAIIHSDGDGAVLLDFAYGACTFCGACARACPTGALTEDRLADWPWTASVAPSCLSLGGVSCRSCEDACDARAIRFRLGLGGAATPTIDQDACTGCGACVAICPTGSVSLTRATTAQKETRQ